MYRCTKHHCSLLEFLKRTFSPWLGDPLQSRETENVVYRFTELFSYTEKKNKANDLRVMKENQSCSKHGIRKTIIPLATLSHVVYRRY